MLEASPKGGQAGSKTYLSEGQVRAIADYTRIDLPEAKLGQMTVDLNNIIETLQPIRAYDLDGVEPTFHPIAGLSNVMREDQVKVGLAKADALALAAHVEDGRYRVPAILGESENGA